MPRHHSLAALGLFLAVAVVGCRSQKPPPQMPTPKVTVTRPASAEVRDYWLSLLRETLEYDIDGIVLYFHRFHPFVAFEQPVVDAFQAKHGEDPRRHEAALGQQFERARQDARLGVGFETVSDGGGITLESEDGRHGVTPWQTDE